MLTKASFTTDPNTDIRTPVEKALFNSINKIKRQSEKPLSVKTAYSEVYNQTILLQGGVNFGKGQVFGTNFFPQYNAWQYYTPMSVKNLKPARNIVFSFGILGAVASEIPVIITTSTIYSVDVFFVIQPFLSSRKTGPLDGDWLLFQFKIGKLTLVEVFPGSPDKYWAFVGENGVFDTNTGFSLIQKNIDMNSNKIGVHKNYQTDGNFVSTTMLDDFINNGDFISYAVTYNQTITSTWPMDIQDTFNFAIVPLTKFFTTTTFSYYSTTVSSALK